ncbi:MAG: uncharacterized protein QOF14_4807 [Hyphomicrobiales bacterium]|jgi:predicted RNA-binding protein YlxR (DUF448 family)|nr:uncharacterized protein [Hyphomicrobiales bacterium]
MLARADMQETDSGPREGRRGTERLCALTREVRPIDELIRFVVGPDGTIVPDLKRRLPGRGVWITARRAAIDEAIKRNAFARSLKRDAKAASDLGVQIERQLENAALDALGIAHKAGRLAIGFGRTETALGAVPPVAAILSASDGSPEGARKIAAAAARRQTGENAPEIPVIAAFTSAQLDLALGRSNVVHAALLAGPASNGFLARCQSLERFRTIDPGGRGAG